MPTINDRIGSQNVIRVLSNASAPPTRITNLTDVDSTRKTLDGQLLVWNLSDEKFYMTDTIDTDGLIFTGGGSATGITTFAGTVDSTSSTTGAVLVSGGVGVGKNLNVGQDFKVVGIATFSNELDINAAVDILRGLNVSGITSVLSLSIGSTQVISSARELQNISSLDSTTTATIEAAIKVAPNTFTDLKITGISTFIGIATFGGGIAVQAGVSTFDVAVDINAGLDVDGQADLDEVVIAGVTTHNEDVYFPGAAYNMQWDKATSKIKFDDSAQAVFGSKSGGDLRIWHGGTHSFIKNETGDLRIRGDIVKLRNADDDESFLEATADADVKIFYNNIERVATTAEGIDVTGRTETDLLNVSGVSTFASAVDINAGLDVDGQADLDEVVVAGAATFSSTVTVSGNLDIADTIYHTGDSNTKIRFPATDTISFHTSGNEALRINSSQNVNFLGNLINVNATGISSFVQLDVSTGGLDVDGQTDLDEVVVAGVATFSNTVDINGVLDIDGQLDVDELVVAGVSTFSSAVDINSTLDVDGDTQVDDLNVAGVATFSKLIDANNRIDVVGGINGDQLYVAIATVTNTATFESAIVAESSLDVDGTTDLDVLNVAEDATFDGEVIVASNIKHKGDSDTYIEFTADKIRLIAGGKGLIDATEATTDSVTINDGGNDLDFRVEGIDDEYQIFSDGLTNKVGIGVSVPGAKLDVGGTLNVTGVSTFSALIDANARLDVVGGANIDQLNVTGVTTFGDDVTFTAGGLNVTGIITATELDIGTGGIDVDGQTDLDELVVAGIATFSTDVNITGLLTAGAIDGGTY